MLQLMLNEYILHEVERLVCEDSMRELMLNMVNSQATELSDSSFIDSLGPDFLSNPNVFQSEGSSYQPSGRSTSAAATGSSATLTEGGAVLDVK